MKSEIKAPSMGESISEVVIGSLLVNSGSLVKADQEILELETDKVNQLLYAPQAGLLTLTVKSGDVVKIGQLIGTVESESSETTRQPDQSSSATIEKPPNKQEKLPVKEEKKIEKEPIEKEAVEKEDRPSIRVGKEGFIAGLQEKSAVGAEKAKEQEPLVDKKQPESIRRETRRKMSKIRKVIASRLVEVHRTTAMLTTFNEVDLSQIIKLREAYKESFSKRHGVKLGFMSFFVKAVVAGLEEFPDLNSYIQGEEIVHREYYDIGIAVGTDKGVIVPVLRGCDSLSFAAIELEIENYAKKAREGALTMQDLQGAGFTITNGGVYGSLLSTPIISLPQSGILGMHKIEKRPVAIDDQVVVRPMMYLALSYDHRIVDGKEAVSFLVRVKNGLEDPSRLLLNI